MYPAMDIVKESVLIFFARGGFLILHNSTQVDAIFHITEEIANSFFLFLLCYPTEIIFIVQVSLKRKFQKVLIQLNRARQNVMDFFCNN